MKDDEPCICDTGLTCYADEHDDWEATVDGWKAEIEAMTTAELLVAADRENRKLGEGNRDE